jgi:hypothetical protein
MQQEFFLIFFKNKPKQAQSSDWHYPFKWQAMQQSIGVREYEMVDRYVKKTFSKLEIW